MRLTGVPGAFCKQEREKQMKKWWQEAVLYEIYLKSFYDQNGDGIGDLPGVLQKLPVLKELGIDCIWFTPIYASPQVDNGYDVSDYRRIDPAYGTLEDFRRVLERAHELGIRVVMDQVLNHTSDEHYWFRESRKSKDNPYRNYYIWQPPKADGSEPNNWGSYFREGKGSAWEFDPGTGEYYLHQYSVKMPDLNWEYRPLREEIYEMLRWWVSLGVDGFRLDIFTRLKKPEGFPDTRKEPDVLLDRNGFVVDKKMCTNVPGIHEIIHELYTEVFGPCGSYTVGEGAGVNSGNALSYIGKEREELDTVYHFELAGRSKRSMKAEDFRRVQRAWYEVQKAGGWETQHFSNHDSPRQVSSYGNDGEFRTASARLLAVLLLTTPGTPILYQGEEIGMVNVQYGRIEDYNDRYTVGDFRSMTEKGMDPEMALKRLAPISRDNARTPYQWDDSPNAGFTEGTPWLKLNPRYPEINLKKDREDPDGVFSGYRTLIRIRREHPVILDGTLRFYLEDDPAIVAYTRENEEESLLVLANLSDEEVPLSLPRELALRDWKPVFAGRPELDPSLAGKKSMAPWESLVFLS